MNLWVSFLSAILEVFLKVWQAPDRVKALRELTHAERFVVAIAIALLLVCVKATVAL